MLTFTQHIASTATGGHTIEITPGASSTCGAAACCCCSSCSW